MKINVTYRPNIIDLGEDEEFGNMASEDSYFVVSGVPTKYVSAFWKKVLSIKGCFRRPIQIKKGAREDGRLRIDWDSGYYDYYEDVLLIKEKILEVIKCLVPNVKIRYRQLGSGFSVMTEDYSPDDEILLEGTFTDEEKDCLPRYLRGVSLGIKI